MPDIIELCGTGGCPKANSCAKKIEPESSNVRVSKFSYDFIHKKFNCTGYQKVYKRFQIRHDYRIMIINTKKLIFITAGKIE